MADAINRPDMVRMRPWKQNLLCAECGVGTRIQTQLHTHKHVHVLMCTPAHTQTPEGVLNGQPLHRETLVISYIALA